MIKLDVFNKILHLEVSDDEIAVRKVALVPFEATSDRGYTKIRLNKHILALI